MEKEDVILARANCVEYLKTLPEKSVDLIFADPPYNLSGKGHLTGKNGKKVPQFIRKN